MRPHFAAFFQHAHADVAPRIRCQLLQFNRGRQARHARAHNYHIVLHRIAFSLVHGWIPCFYIGWF